MDTLQIPLPTAIASFAAYYFVELLVKAIFKTLNPTFYGQLQSTGRLPRYFAFVMGILITFFSTPLCMRAFLLSTDETDQYRNPDFSNLSAQVCVISRSVLWVSELNRLDYATVYLLHHTGSLAQLILHLVAGIPLRPVYLIYASLVTELVSDTRALLGLHGLNDRTSSIARKVHGLNTILQIFIRLPPIIFGWTYTLKDWNRGWSLFFSVVTMTVYTLFIVRLIIIGAPSMGLRWRRNPLLAMLAGAAAISSSISAYRVCIWASSQFYGYKE